MDTYAVLDPSTGETVKTYPTATDDEVRRAVDSVAGAHATWSARSLADRVEVVRRIAQLHAKRADELASIIQREMGKPMQEGRGELSFCTAIYDYYAEHAEQLLADQPIELLAGDGSAVIRRSSVGALLGIMPWNFPYYQVARFAGPNLIVGNTILLKHAPQCPESSAALADLYSEAGCPDGVYVNIYASNEQVADVIADPRIQGVSLTGSARAGAAVAALAGRHLKKVVLELGGSDPFLLLSTDDLDATVDAAVIARLANTGQACDAGKRFIVVDELYDAFVEKFAEKLSQAWTGAPLSSPRAADTLADQVDRAVSQGAHLITFGRRKGCYFPPGVLTGVTPQNDIYREELFGPVATVYRVADEQQAVDLANDTTYGLGSYVFTTDPEQARRVADAIQAGMVYVNGVAADGAELPFGGVKGSGFGRELGPLGIDEFVNKKLIRVIR